MNAAKAVLVAAAALGALALPDQAQAEATSACDDPFVAELLATGDAFRAVTVLKQRELEARGTARGFDCARRLLGLYLGHDEHDEADGLLARMLTLYPGETVSVAPAHQLRAEMALVFRNAPEIRARLARGPAFAGADVLESFSRALERPGTATPVACAGRPCDELRALVAEDVARGRKSPAFAGVLGLVPGLGQAYAGRVLAGFGSFLLNAFLIGTASYAWIEDEHAFAVFATGLAAASYLGNVYAGYEAARRENEVRDRAFVERVAHVPLDLAIGRLAR